MPERKKKSKEKISGGSSPVKVKQTPKEKTEIEEAVSEIPIEEIQPEVVSEVAAPSPELAMINEALIEASAKMVGKTVELITRIPEMNFDDKEIEQLKRLWSPLLPTMNPVLAAIVGTLIIVGGKVTIYVSLRKERPTREEFRKQRETEEEPVSES